MIQESPRRRRRLQVARGELDGIEIEPQDDRVPPDLRAVAEPVAEHAAFAVLPHPRLGEIAVLYHGLPQVLCYWLNTSATGIVKPGTTSSPLSWSATLNVNTCSRLR